MVILISNKELRKELLKLTPKPTMMCFICGKMFKPKMKTARYCSKNCLKKSMQNRQIAKRKLAVIEGTTKSYLKLRFSVLKRDGFICRYCGRGVAEGTKLQIDHIHPRSKEGSLAIDNLITSCLECNLGKMDVVLSKREKKQLLSYQEQSVKKV